MKIINTCLITFLILLLGVGFVSATDDGIVSDANATVLNSVADDLAMDNAEDMLNTADDEVIGGGNTHVEVNSYDHFSLNPHSVDVNDDSDYVAYVYAPNESQGNVSVLIEDEDGENIEIFNRDIQSLYHEADANDTSFSYFYIKPSDIISSLEPELYYVTVVYKYGLTLTESNDGWVRIVNDTSHVSVNAPSEILIGDPFNSIISIFVEGTLGNIRVLIDNQEIINDSVFDLKYDEETQEFNNYIHVDLKELSLGQHTYEISYYGGNWKDVTFKDNINVTYLFDVIVDDDYYYGDEVTFMIVLPNDASSNEIRVNNKRYNIDLEDGVASLTLSDLNLGENALNFVYNDVKYGEKSFPVELIINPAVNVPSTVKYGSGENIIIEFPSDAQGKLNILSNGYLMDSVDVAGGMVTYSFATWQIGSYELELQYDDGNYYISKEVTIDVIPNVEYKKDLTIGENSYVSVDMGVDGNITVFCNGEKISTANLVNGKMNITIPSSNLHLGENILTLKYEGTELIGDPFCYYDYETQEIVQNQYVLTVGPDYLGIPDEFSQDGSGNIILGLPEGFNGNLEINVNGGLLSTTRVSGGLTNILVTGLKTESNNVNLILTDEDGYSYNVTKSVNVPKIDAEMNITLPSETAVPMLTITLPNDATGRLVIKIGDYFNAEKLTNGRLTVTIPGLVDGEYNATILYSDDDKYASFTKIVMLTIKTVDFKDPKLTITVPSTYQGKNSVITVNTDSSFTGTVNVKIKSSTYAINVVNGKGTKSISGLKEGTYTAVATFAETNLFKSSTKSVSFKVMPKIKLTLKKVKVKKSAKKLVIKATLKINGKVAKGKKLKFKFKGKTYKAKTNKKGVAKITIKKNVLKKLKVGKKVKYQVTYSKKTVKRTVKVKK